MQAHEALASLTNSSLFPREQKDGWKLLNGLPVQGQKEVAFSGWIVHFFSGDDRTREAKDQVVMRRSFCQAAFEGNDVMVNVHITASRTMDLRQQGAVFRVLAWAALTEATPIVVFGNTAISGSALRMISKAWWLIDFLHFYIHGFDHCAGFENSYYCTHDRISMAGARRRIFDVSSLQFLEEGARVPESEGTFSEQLVQEDAEDQASEVQAAHPSLCGGALRSDIMHFLQRRPSQALDDGQPALYLQFRGVSFDTVMDWGVYFYTRDIFDALCFYRYMLEGQLRDELYAELYN